MGAAKQQRTVQDVPPSASCEKVRLPGQAAAGQTQGPQFFPAGAWALIPHPRSGKGRAAHVLSALEAEMRDDQLPLGASSKNPSQAPLSWQGASLVTASGFPGSPSSLLRGLAVLNPSAPLELWYPHLHFPAGKHLGSS